MARSIKSIVSLNAGEMSPLTDSRVDLAKYQAGCRTLENAIAQKYGGATRRPGLWYVGTSKYGNEAYTVRLQKFTLSTENNFWIEFGHLFVRFVVNKTYVLSGGVPYEIASPYTAETADTIPEVDALQFCQADNVAYITHPDHPPYKLTRISDTNWTLEAVPFNTPALLDRNATQITVAASATAGAVSLVADAAGWVTSTHYEPLNSVKDGGLLYTCLVDHISDTFATELAAGYWKVETIFDAAMVDSVWQLSHLRNSNQINQDITADAVSSSIRCLGAWQVRTYGVWSADIAVQRSDDNEATWQTVRTITGRSDRNADVSGTAEVNALYRLVITNYAVPDPPGATTPRVVFEAVDAFINGLVRITAVADAYHASGTVVASLFSTSATPYWSEAAWSDYRGYPTAITAHEHGVIYGGTAFQPQRIWRTRISDIENFDRGDGTDPTAGFAIDLPTVDNSPIRWLASGVDLMIGLSNGEWVVSTPDTAQVLSITNFKARQHSDHGSNHVQALMAGDALVFVDRFGLTVRQFMFSIATNKYMSQDLTALADHIGFPGIRRMDIQKQFEKYRIIWLIAGGRLIGLTYDLEHEVFGWHRHTGRPGKDEFLSVACAYGIAESFGDAALVAIRRTVGAETFIFLEQMGDIQWEHESFFDPAPVVWGRTWGAPGGGDGEFQWYGFKRYGWSDDGKVADYWLVKTGSGSGDQNQYISTPLTTEIGTVFGLGIGGAIVVNKRTGLVTGNFAGQWLYQGTLCNGSSFNHLDLGVTVEVGGDNIGQLLPFYTDVIGNDTSRSYFSRGWVGPGWLVTYCENGVWGDGAGSENLSVQMGVEDAATNGGSVQIPFSGHSRISSYNPTTGLAQGTVSELDVVSDAASKSGAFLVTYSYIKTPLAGGPGVAFSETLTYPVTIGDKLNVQHVVPMIVGYDVACTGIVIRDLYEIPEDFEQVLDAWHGEIPRLWLSTARWPQFPSFFIDLPGDCYEDFEGMADSALLIGVFDGDYWPASGTFGWSDYLDAYDDFEAIADGEMVPTHGGVGWARFGHFLIYDYPTARDDFERYTDGTYAALTDNFELAWAGDGTFEIADYLISLDDFESYGDGTYSTLTGGLEWAAAGTFHQDL